ncbi:MAG: DUF5343 domain-containing protein [Candidatus Eremiobacteraeota bacterium]|nr:DUF5343 domain-containing protein [Candidatus Eremiobacteraeota bacterium]
MMMNLAGGDRPKMLAALRFMGLVSGPQDKPTRRFEELRDAADNEDLLRQVWLAILTDTFQPVFTKLDLSTATQGEIDELFRSEYKIQGDTVRKAVAFFLALCRNAGITLSSYVKKGRQGVPGVARPRTSRPRTGRKIQGNGGGGTGQTEPIKPPSGASAITVPFKSGGSATLYVNVDLVAISNADRKALLSWIDAMKRYAAANPVAEKDEAQAAT